MASTHFTTGTTITSEWLNDVNDAVYEGNITAEGVQYTPPFTGGVTETVEAKLAQTVSVKNFGAVGDGVTDDTAAIQAALDYVCGEGRGCVHFPAGTYKTTDTLEITSDNISIVGDGVGATFIFPTGDFGDSLYVYPPSAVNLQRFSMRDMSFYQQGETTSGAHVHLVKVNNSKMTDVELTAKYGGLWCESAVNCNFANVSLFSDAEFTTFQGGSYLFKASKHATGVNPAELYFVNCNWRGQNGNNYLNYGALITCCDGIGIINSHIGFCRIGVALLPETNTTALVGVDIAPVSIDTCRDVGLQVAEPSASYTGTFGGHNFLGGFIYNVTAGNAVSWDCQATSLSSFQNIIVTEIYVHAFQFGNYARVSLRGIDMDSINKVGGSGAGFILNNNTSEITIDGFTIWGTGYTPAAGVEIGTGCRAISVMNGRINKATYPVINNSYNYGDVIFTNVTNEYPVTAVSPNSSGNLILPLPNSTYQLSTPSGYGVGSIDATSAAYGRVVTIYASGNVSIFDTNNLKINGTFNMTNVDTITLVCDGTNWLEVSRSDNG